MTHQSLWSYDDQDGWERLECSQCKGIRQSPVAIYDEQAEESPNLAPLKFEHWGRFALGTATNITNGRSINFAPAPGTQDAIFINHKGRYVLQQFHMHWGLASGEGSEHVLNGKQYEAEIHFVHLKEGANPAAPSGDSYAVLGVFCEEEPQGETTGVWKQLLVPKDYGAQLPIFDVNYKDLLPTDTEPYYHYEGSLTTPPCSEIVMWYVLKNHIKIPSTVLNQFRQITDVNGNRMGATFRKVQPMNGRIVQNLNLKR